MFAFVILALVLPLITGAATLLARNNLTIKTVNILGSLLTGLTLAWIVKLVVESGPFETRWLYVDALSALLLLVVAILGFTSTLFSLSYMDRELQEERIKPKAFKRYYILIQFFIFTMITVLVVGNLGLMWVGVEATTLASTLLVAFYFNRSALEAAWKYVMVCNVGILFALLGTILIYYTQVSVVGQGDEAALNWSALREISGYLNPTMIKLAFVFILIGYGTKMGLAPMHTWLPDAYSQAPSPVGGLLSGALVSCAAYAIIRNLIIVQAAIGTGFTHSALLAFGLFSVAVAIPFILIQHDIKRLLAYSSVEHMGIVAFGLGIGSKLALFGVAWHILNHAVVKSALFYIVGTICQQYRSKNIMRIRGLFARLPGIGALFVIAILAIVGTPPLNIFMSKLTIILSAFQSGKPLLGSVMLFLMAGVFAGMLFYCTKMLFGEAPARFEPVTIGKPALTAITVSIVWVIVTGMYLPPWLNQLLTEISVIVAGRGC